MKCQVCGAASGKYPLCRACNLKKEKGEVIKCSVCNNWHYASVPCSIGQTSDECPYLYEVRQTLISKTEQGYYQAILESVPIGYHVFPQINLATFIYRTDKAPYRNELFRNVDFLITDAEYAPKIVIEINDMSHYSPERKERDEKVRKICEEAGIAIVTLWTSYGINAEYIKKRITEDLNTTTTRIHHFSTRADLKIEPETLSLNENDTKSRYSKVVAILLCLLGFVGFGGLHRMYAGKVSSGVVYFFTLGGFFIGTCIDLIAILLGKFTDSNGQSLK